MITVPGGSVELNKGVDNDAGRRRGLLEDTPTRPLAASMCVKRRVAKCAAPGSDLAALCASNFVIQF